MGMNATLEKAIGLARQVPSDAQEGVGQEILAIIEKSEIVRQLDASEAEGGEVPLEEACGRLREKLHAKYGL